MDHVRRPESSPTDATPALPRSASRRRLVRGTIAVAGAAVAATYVPPRLTVFGVIQAQTISGPTPAAVRGSPSFWKDTGNGQQSKSL